MTVESEVAVRVLARVAQLFGGVVPNLYRVLARQPAALQAFVAMEEALATVERPTEAGRALVALEVAIDADCRYCQSVFVKEARALGVAEGSIEAVLTGTSPADRDDEVVVTATRRLLASRGRLRRFEIADLARRGLGERELLAILTVVAAYTLATHANNLARTRIDPEFRL